MYRPRFMGCIILLVLSVTGPVFADDYHYANLLVGDRASGMGGAYTAVSDDATGLYYNPAGIAYASGRSISASVNAFYNVDKKYDSVIAGNGWLRQSSSLLPNYFGVAQPIGRFKIGLSYAVPEALAEDQDQVFHNLPLSSTIQQYNPGADISTYIINFNSGSNTYQFGPSIAMELTDKLAAGLTLYFHQRRSQWILNQLIKTSNGGYEWTNDYYQVDEWGVRPILGFMWTPVQNVSIGLALSKVYIQESDTKYQHSYRRENIAIDNNPANSNVVDLPDGQITSNEKRTYPTQVSFGVAYFASPSLLITGDINHYSAVETQDAEEVNNIAIGTEYYLDRNWALRGGFYTDYANTPKVVSGKVNQKEHIDLYGITVSATHFTRNTSVTLGGGIAGGDGKAQIIGNSTAIQDAHINGWMLFLSSSYSY